MCVQQFQGSSAASPIKVFFLANGYIGSKGLCKVEKNETNPKKLDRAHPTYPPPSILYNVYTDIIHMVGPILLQNVCTGLELFWDDFPKEKIFRVRPGPTHPLP